MNNAKTPAQKKIKIITQVEPLQKRKKIIASAIDFLKTVAIYMLTATMLMFAGLYINARQHAGRAASEISPEKMRIFESSGTVLAEIDENQIKPVQITATVDNKSYTAVYDDSIISDIYEDFTYSIKSIFGGNFKCAKLGKEAGALLWKECTLKENSVYIRYAGDYLYPVIYTFLDKSLTGVNSSGAFSGELAEVRELFIIDEEPVYGVSRDSGGNVAVFMPEEQADNTLKSRINTAISAAAYNNSVVIRCEFLKGDDISEKTGINANNIKNLKFPDSFHLFHSYNTYSQILRYENPILDADGEIDTKQSFITEFFKLSDFNIDSAVPYHYRNGITFRDGKNTVNFYGNGLITYIGKLSESTMISGAGGIHLSKFLGSGAEVYTFYEKIKAASVFVNSIPGEFRGNESSLYLKSITSDSNDILKLVFSYYYEGIKIKVNGSDEGVTVEINNDRITEVKINALNVSSQNMNMIKDRSFIFELSAIDDMISKNTEKAIEAKLAEYNSDSDSEEITESADIDIDMADIKEPIAKEYKLSYDKIQDKFIVNAFDLVYNIDYTKSNDGEKFVEAVWEMT